MLYSNNKELQSNMDELQKHYTEQKEPDAKLTLLCDCLYETLGNKIASDRKINDCLGLKMWLVMTRKGHKKDR